MFWRQKQVKVQVKWCSNCRFWSDEYGVGLWGTAEQRGWCRRYPAQIVFSSQPDYIRHTDGGSYIPDNAFEPKAVFPYTSAVDWCGEWLFPGIEDQTRAGHNAHLKEQQEAREEARWEAERARREKVEQDAELG